MKWIAGSSVHGSWPGTYESEKQWALERPTYPGMTVYSIGAQTDLYTLLFSRLVLPMSEGNQLVGLVYIDDVVGAYLIAARRLLSDVAQAHECYAVGSGRTVKSRQLVEAVARSRGKAISVAWGAHPYRKREVMVPWSEGKLLPGRFPKVSMEEGLGRLERGVA